MPGRESTELKDNFLEPFILCEPWHALDPIKRICVKDLSELYFDGRGSARFLLPQYAGQPIFRGQQLPTCSFPFEIDGTIWQAYSLPLDSRFVEERHSMGGELRFNQNSVLITQENILGRPISDNDQLEGSQVDRWIRWQVQRYQELADGTKIDAELLEDKTSHGVVRRSWRNVIKEWINPDFDEPKMALIVKFSQDRHLNQSLESIAKSPRHILERVRKLTPINRMQEIDSACIRDYAKRPGRNAAQKAGLRQSLLAVQRREFIDTLENRLTNWVLHEIKSMSTNYLNDISRIFGDTHTSIKYDLVNRFKRETRVLLSEPSICEMTLPKHLPSQPNYPLQFEKRYKKIWYAYVNIRSEKKVIDDAWAWQRPLWAETGRQLFHSVLTKKWKEYFVSTPYYSAESTCGQWLCANSTPGPFKTHSGPCEVYDCRDIHNTTLTNIWLNLKNNLPANRLGSVGCEQILWWPELNTGIVIWYPILDTSNTTLQEYLQSATKCLSTFNQQNNCTRPLCGLMLCADIVTKDHANGIELDRYDAKDEFCIGLRIPPEAHLYADDLEAGIVEAIEAFGVAL